MPKKPQPSTSTWLRARAALVSHPKISWVTLGAIVGIFGVLAPWAYSGWKSWDERYEKADDYKAGMVAVRAELATEVGKVRGEMQAKLGSIDRRLAFSAAADAKRDAVVMRNRVNDCNVRLEQPKNPLTPTERAACKQYDDEWRTANDRAEAAQREAMALTRP